MSRFGIVDEVVEFFDAAEGVFVGGVSVEEFVLDEAIEGTEFWEVSAQDAGAVHETEGMGDLTFTFEDFAEGFAIFGAEAEGAVDLGPVCLDEFAEGGRG